ncbi:hypothetical protein Desor_5243 [Desulfosporosinus orientis DSM 765]|uniref:DUF4363 family protein n=1 Tax=Desulfosporosinus orientis (strain ATCC 19365 / DSM 765 / NCIMB 8382 / VKM B-1628 / Singapore I) TaxID=768706 RepID=G7W9R1_DESOD|nr:DUF4363 family protein [Desulfosporosinus orientis]AET70627.1 hypothetical protein Desor_5243 [Desulfosporosinus orientis DSM 765]
MLRTVSTIIVIILFFLIGSITSYRFVENTTDTASAHLQVIQESIYTEKWQAANEELAIVQENWNNNGTWWSVILDHQEIDRIDLAIERLRKFIESKDPALSLGEVTSLKQYFDFIHDNERLSLKNIL